MDTLFLDGGQGSTPSSVNVHPVILFSLLDQHMRRGENQDRVIGVLLGTVQGGIVEVTNSFGVHHVKREGEVLVRRTAVLDLLALHKKINSKEVVVGWYATTSDGGDTIDDFTLAVHDFFSDFAAAPVHLLVDVSLARPRVGVDAFVATAAGASKLVRATLVPFTRLRVGLGASPEERVGLDALTKATLAGASAAVAAATLPAESADAGTDLDALEGSMRRLKALLETTLAYVEDTVAGRRPADEAAGRAIAETLAAVPAADTGAFERTWASSVQDVLMVSYLAHLTQAQMRLAEKIAAL